MKRISMWVAVLLLPISFAMAQRLPKLAVPENYKLKLTPDFTKDNFAGNETIQVQILKPTSQIVLNSAELDFGEVSVTASGMTQKGTVSLDTENEQATLSFEKELAPGAANLHIVYTGILNDQMRGFYLGKDPHGRKYAATQFEATDARRAYPSFDEPSYKATFDITAVAPKGMVAISNTKIVSDSPGPDPDQHTVRFATSPKMSSYLAALIVGDFASVEGEADGIPIRVWATDGRQEQGRFALEAAESILKFYDRYFQIKYPYGKLDLVALPDFSAGAMENTGCITFRELVLLLDEQHASIELRKAVASVLAHEMAHQWFGDLVTTAWWDDIWLNEGFATWMSSKPVEAFKPEWHVELDDVQDTARSLNVDSLENTRPIHQAASTPAEILELFDGIAYGKTAAVLRMLENYLGPEAFREGVNLYLKTHAYGNATASDFWSALAKVSNKPIDKVMPTFVEQAGAPLVSLTSQCVGGSTNVTLKQERYFYDRSLLNGGNKQLWQIPVCLRAGGETGKGSEHCELLTKREDSVALPGCGAWVLANAGADGYYRSGYQPETMVALAQNVETALTPSERIMLLSDAWSAVRVGREPIGDYLVLAEGLKTDRNPAVMEQLLAQLQLIGMNLVNDQDRPAYQAWIRGLMKPALKEVGLESHPGDTDEQKAMRARLFISLGISGRDPDVLAEARKVTDEALANPLSVDRELAFAAFRVAASNGDSALYDKILADLKTVKTPEEYYLYQRTLAEFGDAQLLERTLEYAVSPEVRSQDAIGMIANVMNNPKGEKLAWDFVQSHWSAVEKAGGPFASAEIVAEAGRFCSAGMQDQVKSFFAAHPVSAAERTLRQTVESIGYCVDLQSQQGPQLADWLGHHGGATASGK